jgi:DNA-binding NtrC family response regulator
LDDIPFLIDYFISELCHQSNREKPLLTKDAMLLLLEYHYPGNVRELRNIINRSLMLHTKPVLAVEDILLSRQSTSQMQVYDDFEGNVQLAQAQERLIRIAMHKCNNVQAKAAKLLGISPSSLNRKLKKMTF